MTLKDEPIRLVPSPLWGVSLASLCTAKTWDTIRAEAAEQAGGRCRFCDDPGPHRSSPLHGHERWRYDGDRATLEAVWTVCGWCHDVLHPGRVLSVQGEAGYRRVLHLYARRCGMPVEDAARRYDQAFRDHGVASQIAVWTLDLGAVASHLPLRAKRSAHTKINGHRWIGTPFAA